MASVCDKARQSPQYADAPGRTSGFHVIATARRLAVLDELADIGMTTLAVDVTKPESIAAAKEAVAALTGGRLDVLVNNAYVHSEPIPQIA